MNKKVLIVILLIVVFNYTISKYTTSEVKISDTLTHEVVEQLLFEEEVSESVPTSSLYLVTRVIDGDTIDVEINGVVKRVRYIGIDTPENTSANKPAECFAKEATERNRELVEGKYVVLVKDISEADKYGRLLRYVYVEDYFVNLALVEGGYANVLRIPPDVNKADIFLQAQQIAKKEGRGLWGDVCK